MSSQYGREGGGAAMLRGGVRLALLAATWRSSSMIRRREMCVLFVPEGEMCVLFVRGARGGGTSPNLDRPHRLLREELQRE